MAVSFGNSAEPPGESLERAVDLLVDYLAVARRGAPSRSTAAVRSAVATAGGGRSLLDAGGGFASAENAALVNGTAAHGIELDDTYESGSLHPGVAVWPAVLALADELRSPAAPVLAAAVRGYDVVCDLGDRLGAKRAYARGFHPTGVCGVVGAAAACAQLLELDEEGSRHAVGIAASMAAGLLAFLDDGAWTKPLHAGRAAEGGIRAARLAAAGFVGPSDPFGGEHGLLHAFGGEEELAMPVPVPGFGVLQTSIKLYPSCRYTHGCIDLLLELGPEPEAIEAVDCAVLRGGWTLVADPIERKRRAASTVDAQFSMPFTAALAIAEGGVRLDDVERAAELGPKLEPIMDRVSCFEDAEIESAYPASWGAVVRVRYRDGAVEERRSSDPLGSPSRPLDRDGILAKAAGLLGADWASEAGRAVAGLADASDLSAVLEPLRGGRS
ncbi:MAG TPA: MmgE/PrpD family protein [Solirubrobacterales bacterium]|nr:MmgE/PrpD family protein [Solirubrobacterales bacterium]